jgi:hypothetical protein
MLWIAMGLVGCTGSPSHDGGMLEDSSTDARSDASLADTGGSANAGDDLDGSTRALDADGEAPREDAGDAAQSPEPTFALCSQSCGSINCGAGDICLSQTNLGVLGGTCVLAPLSCGDHPSCSCLASLCRQDSYAICYDQADLHSAVPACVSGVTCAPNKCTHPAASVVPCNGAPCAAGQVCVHRLAGVPDGGSPPRCESIPAACADNPSCGCMGPTLCLGDNLGFRCSDDADAGCSYDVTCNND